MKKLHLTRDYVKPRRGDVWMVNFDPSIGSEIRRAHPGIIVNSDGLGALPLRWVVPTTDWKPHYSNQRWMIPIESSPGNGLNKKSAIDTLQTKSISELRLIHKIGSIEAELMEEIVAAIAMIIEYH